MSTIAYRSTSPAARLAAALAIAACGAPGPALGWIYPEHRYIAVLAVEKLDPERRAVL